MSLENWNSYKSGLKDDSAKKYQQRAGKFVEFCDEEGVNPNEISNIDR
jgi:hypothetical protein